MEEVRKKYALVEVCDIVDELEEDFVVAIFNTKKQAKRELYKIKKTPYGKSNVFFIDSFYARQKRIFKMEKRYEIYKYKEEK